MTPLAATPLARIEPWLASHRRKVLVVVVVLAALLRTVAFHELHHSPVMGSHEYSQMDMEFFNQWALKIAREDALGRAPIHPLHVWHTQVAGAHYDKHPRILGKRFNDLAEKDRDAATRKIWDKWYGGARFHQEPLYPYLVAMLYKIWGAPEARFVYAVQMLGGVLTVALLFLLTVRLFGDLTALLTAGLAMLWGPLIHYEATLLRTSFISLTGIALLYCGQCMIDSRDRTGAGHTARLLAFGCLIGAATALKSTFLVFSCGLLVVLFWPMRRQVKKVVVQGAIVTAGIVLILAPIWVRNHLVGAPLFSMTSVGPVTFAGTNVPGYVPSLGWYPYMVPDLVAQVMEECEGSLLCVVSCSIALHDSLADYFALLFGKFAQVWHWCELRNNTNYYYSCLHSDVLAVSRYVVSALWILPAGLVGIAISLRQRRQVGTWLWYLVWCLVPLVVFYVISRFRVPLVVAMMPFAAFAVVQIVDRLLTLRLARVAAPAVALALLLAIMARPIHPPRPLVDPGAYNLPFHHYYMPKIERARQAGDHAAAVEVLESLLATRPGFIDELGLTRSIDTIWEVAIADEIFSVAYRMCAGAAAAAKRDQLARHCHEQAARLDAAAKRYYDEHPDAK